MQPAFRAEVANGAVRHRRPPDARQVIARSQHRPRLPQFTVRPAVFEHDPFDALLGRDSRASQRRAVHRREVAAHVIHEDWPLARCAVQVARQQPFAREVDGVQPPGDERLGRVLHRRRKIRKPLDDGVKRLASLPALPTRVRPWVVANIGKGPERPREDMRVRLNVTRHYVCVAKAVVDRVVAPSRHLVDSSHREYVPVAHRDSLRARLRRVHRDHRTGREYCECRHSCSSLRSPAECTPGDRS